MDVIYKIEEESSFDDMMRDVKKLSKREQETVADTLRGFLMARRFAGQAVEGTSELPLQ